MNNQNRLSTLLTQHQEKKAQNPKLEPLLTLFITAGYPEKETFHDLIRSLDLAGADILEIGMPFSDPLADGPVIQMSSQKALESGVDLEWIFDSIQELRKSTQIPILLMGYFNPVLSYGVENFFVKAASAGIDGIILPDLPAEETKRIKPYADKLGLKLIGFVTPTSTEERIRLIDQAVDGFIYTVLVTGVTGGTSLKDSIDEIQNFLKKVRQNTTKNPIMAGFGIRSGQDVLPVKEWVDGYIVGSELIRKIEQAYPDINWIEQVQEFVKAFKIK